MRPAGKTGRASPSDYNQSHLLGVLENPLEESANPLS
jgi:hypothetical protein